MYRWAIPILLAAASTVSQAQNPAAQLPSRDVAAFLAGVKFKSEVEIAPVERILAKAPNNVEAHIKLLGCYWMGKNADPRFGRELLWLVDHDPESQLFETGILQLGWLPDAATITAYRAHWESAAALHPGSAAVLAHAATEVGEVHRGLAYARRAVAADPSCIQCRQVLGSMIGTAILRLPASLRGAWTCEADTPEVEQGVGKLRQEMESSADAEVVLDAGMTIKGYSGVYGSKCGGDSNEAARLGGELIRKAVRLDPTLVLRRHLQAVLDSIH